MIRLQNILTVLSFFISICTSGQSSALVGKGFIKYEVIKWNQLKMPGYAGHFSDSSKKYQVSYYYMKLNDSTRCEYHDCSGNTLESCKQLSNYKIFQDSTGIYTTNIETKSTTQLFSLVNIKSNINVYEYPPFLKEDYYGKEWLRSKDRNKTTAGKTIRCYTFYSNFSIDNGIKVFTSVCIVKQIIPTISTL